MKKETLWNIICLIALALQVIVEGFVLAILLRLNILPPLYLTAVIVLMVLAAGGVALLMFLRRKEKQVSTVRRVIAIFLALVIVVLCVLAYKGTSKIDDMLQGITTPVGNTVTRGVYVRIDDPAQTLQDAADYRFGIIENYDVENTQKAIEAIENELGKSIEIVKFDTANEMIAALYDGSIEAIILNGGYLTILEETEAFSDFGEKVRLLYDAHIQVETKPTEPDEIRPGANPNTPTDVTNTPFVVYISGSDTRNSYLPTSTRSDVNILAVVNPVSKQVLLLNTPRDYYVENPVGGNARDKLTHCGIYGIDCSIEALENLYDVPIDYYAKINFTGFETLIDAVGGITVYSDVAFQANRVWINAGENYLNGEQALAFSRERYHLSGGDNARGKNQMKVISAVIKKLTSGTTIIANYSAILDSLKGMFATDMQMVDISRLVKMQLADMAMWNVVSYANTGNTGSEITYSMPGEYLSVMYVDQDRVEYASELIDRVMEGDVLTEADLNGPVK